MAINRRAGTASAAVLSGIMITVGLASMAAPRWFQQIGLEIWTLTEHRKTFRAAALESARIEDEASQLWASIQAVEYTANCLIAGTLSLVEACETAETFMLNRPGFSSASQGPYIAPTPRLTVARYLIARVRSILENDPERLAPTLVRVEAEYRVMLRKERFPSACLPFKFSTADLLCTHRVRVNSTHSGRVTRLVAAGPLATGTREADNGRKR